MHIGHYLTYFLAGLAFFGVCFAQDDGFSGFALALMAWLYVALLEWKHEWGKRNGM